MDVCDQGFELVLGTLCGEVGDLRLEGADEVCACIDDGFAELEGGIGAACQVSRKTRRVWVEPNTQQRIGMCPCSGERQ